MQSSVAGFPRSVPESLSARSERAEPTAEPVVATGRRRNGGALAAELLSARNSVPQQTAAERRDVPAELGRQPHTARHAHRHTELQDFYRSACARAIAEIGADIGGWHPPAAGLLTELRASMRILTADLRPQRDRALFDLYQQLEHLIDMPAAGKSSVATFTWLRTTLVGLQECLDLTVPLVWRVRGDLMSGIIARASAVVSILDDGMSNIQHRFGDFASPYAAYELPRQLECAGTLREMFERDSAARTAALATVLGMGGAAGPGSLLRDFHSTALNKQIALNLSSAQRLDFTENLRYLKATIDRVQPTTRTLVHLRTALLGIQMAFRQGAPIDDAQISDVQSILQRLNHDILCPLDETLDGIKRLVDDTMHQAAPPDDIATAGMTQRSGSAVMHGL